MRSKVLSCGIRIEDNRSINCGISITNQNNQMYNLEYDELTNQFRFSDKYLRVYYMDDLNYYINALADIIQAMAEANEFVNETK
jgi:hypothetical protein